jgi:hypothetical protein
LCKTHIHIDIQTHAPYQLLICTSMGTKNLLLIFFLLITGSNLLAQAPVISAFSPTSGPVGTLVTVTGTGLNNATILSIGGTTAIIISGTGTQLVGMVMPGAVTSGVSVTTTGGTAIGSGNFTVSGTFYPNLRQSPPLGSLTTGGATLHQAFSSAINADGSTALVGDPDANGQVLVFVRTGANWAQQATLVVNDASGFQNLGYSVALSADGNIAVLGAPDGTGGAWIFTRANNAWTKVATKLTGTGAVTQGKQVAISANGKTIVIDGYNNDNKKAAWVFSKSGSTWTQTDVIEYPGGYTNGTIALSGDASTLAMSGYQGIWIFINSITGWVQQGDKLQGTGAIAPIGTIDALALSADGNTLINGEHTDANDHGAAWFFVRTAGTWSQQGPKITGPSLSKFGTSVSISADGNTAVIGAPEDNQQVGKVYVYQQRVGSWAAKASLAYSNVVTQPGDEGTPDPDDTKYLQGYSVALSADARIVVEGGIEQWANAWIFADYNTRSQNITFNLSVAPVLYGIPDIPLNATSTNAVIPITYSSSDTTVATIVNNKVHLKTSGITTITASQASGSDFYAAAPVSKQLTVDKASVTITADDKTKFAGDPNPPFTIMATGFVSKQDSVAIMANVKISVSAGPTSPVGTYPITTYTTSSNKYTFTFVPGTLTIINAVPTITSFSPTTAIEGGMVTITGTHLDKVKNVKFGSKLASSFSSASPTSITAYVSSGSSGDVSVIAPGGTASLPGFTFIFTLPATNFTLTTTGATCNGSANGSVKITAALSQSSTVTITGNGLNTSYPFTNTKTINNLAAGTYSVCITVAAQPDYKQCYDVVITEPKNLSVYAEVNPGQDQLSLALSGGVNYTIKLNGTQYNTTAGSINLPLSLGDNELEVTTDNLCQGIFKKIFNIGSRIIPYPNPFQSAVKLNLGTKNISAVAVEVYDLADGKLVYRNQYANQSGVLSLELSTLKNHVYSLKLTRDGQENIYKILKQ